MFAQCAYLLFIFLEPKCLHDIIQYGLTFKKQLKKPDCQSWKRALQ